jgi:hypothetical protein
MAGNPAHHPLTSSEFLIHPITSVGERSHNNKTTSTTIHNNNMKLITFLSTLAVATAFSPAHQIGRPSTSLSDIKTGSVKW